jgi:branched-subunit amino acid ABC-type transport system permease component
VEIIRYRYDVWGEEVILGVSWDLLWVVAVVALILLAAHAIFMAALAKKKAMPSAEGKRINRHDAIDRAFHWTMAGSVLVLLGLRAGARGTLWRLGSLVVVLAALVICLATWYGIERTRLGAYLRAATENPTLVRAFGINVPRLITLTYGLGVALAALAGVLAAPIQQVSALMGVNLVLVVFAVVVIGGMGSIMGSIVTGFGLGLVEGLTKVFYPPASNTVIFVVMALVLLIKPAGLFGQTK